MLPVAKTFSWVLVVGGLILACFGVYDYYASQQGQREAGRDWQARPGDEDPVPTAPKGKNTRESLPPRTYFDPYKSGDTVAKLRVPRLATTLFVIEGTDEKDLIKGPGHMAGTALPGVAGNCVIAGHRDTHFRSLEHIREGDEVELDTHYGTFRYVVRSLEIVSPTNVASLQPTNDAVLHLITCYPFHYIGHAPQRMVIAAELQRPANESPATGE